MIIIYVRREEFLPYEVQKMKSIVDENNRMKFALISGCIILGMSIFVAYISFNILGSSAEASLKNWKFGGAFAGFIFTASLLTSIIFQIYNHLTTDRTTKFQEKILELQSKLIKGAPCPEGYEIDIDEKHKLVFARPEDWLPKGGILYQYKGQKTFADFAVHYKSEKDLSDQFKFDSGNVDFDALYMRMANLETLKEGITKGTPGAILENESLINETILVDELKSLKFIFSYTLSIPDLGFIKAKIRQLGVITYVPRLKAVYAFAFTDIEQNFLKSSEVFNNVIKSIRFL
jgi:hypothetical protein